MARPRLRYRSQERDAVDVQGECQREDPYFTSDVFIQTYLNPVTPVGCARHQKPECLCDVDVERTAGFDWSNCPPEFYGITTGAELVEAVANIWLNLDVRNRVEDKGGPLVGHENLTEVLDAIKAGKSFKHCSQLAPLDAKTYLMFRRLFGVTRNRKVLPVDRILELNAEGITGVRAQNILYEETGVLYSLTALRKVLARAEVKSGSPVGAPKRYPHDRIWGLSQQGLNPRQISNVLASEGVECHRHMVARIVRKRRDKLAAQ